MEHLSEFLGNVIDSGKSPKTAEAYASSIACFERTMKISDPGKVTVRDLDAFVRRRAMAGMAAMTRRREISALKSFFTYLSTREFIGENPTRHLKTPAEERKGISTLTLDEVIRLVFAVPAPNVVRARREPKSIFAWRQKIEPLCHARDSFLMAVMYSGALRGSEPGTIAVTGFSVAGDGRGRLAVWRKGRREPQIVDLDPQIAALGVEFMRLREEAGITHPALFFPMQRKRQFRHDGGLSIEGVNEILQKRFRAIGKAQRGRRISTHIFRYSKCNHLYEGGVDLIQLQAFMDHASPQTTMRYIRLTSGKRIYRRANALNPWRTHGAMVAGVPGSR
jgi:site-specific recombinase XerD